MVSANAVTMLRMRFFMCFLHSIKICGRFLLLLLQGTQKRGEHSKKLCFDSKGDSRESQSFKTYYLSRQPVKGKQQKAGLAAAAEEHIPGVVFLPDMTVAEFAGPSLPGSLGDGQFIAAPPGRLRQTFFPPLRLLLIRKNQFIFLHIHQRRAARLEAGGETLFARCT